MNLDAKSYLVPNVVEQTSRGERLPTTCTADC